MKGRQRLIDYVCIVGVEAEAEEETQADAKILRRWPASDHEDFPLPLTLAHFCQPDGNAVISDGEDKSPKESSTFVFTLTDKDSNLTRYAVCHNFYRSLPSPR